MFFLLANAVRNITVGLLIAVLKVILVLGDADAGSKGGKIFNVDDDDDDDDDFAMIMKTGSKRSSNSMQKAKLSDFAKHTLKQICNQEWVHNRCLQVIFRLKIVFWFDYESSVECYLHLKTNRKTKTIFYLDGQKYKRRICPD